VSEEEDKRRQPAFAIDLPRGVNENETLVNSAATPIGLFLAGLLLNEGTVLLIIGNGLRLLRPADESDMVHGCQAKGTR